MLSSPLWNLVFIAALAIMMGYGYFSRHEHTQKLALCILGIWLTSVAVLGTPLEVAAFIFFDVVGVAYCNYLRFIDPKQKVTQLVMWAFIAMIVLHILQLAVGFEWLKYKIAGNTLYMAQLTVLCIYGKRYGIIARAEGLEPRTDPYYRALIACRLMT